MKHPLPIELPEHAIQLLLDLVNDITPFAVRRMDENKRCYEVIRMDHPEWRTLNAEPMTVLKDGLTREEAEALCGRNKVTWAWTELCSYLNAEPSTPD